MLYDIDELYRAVAEERGLMLETRIDARLPLLGDRELVQQAVANLLDNALKFTAPGTVIGFRAKLDEAVIEISIADRGPGIAPEDRGRATERFFRAEAARNTAGSGLGLALVAAVAQLHNGTLHLADNHPGLRAIISLPVQGRSAWGEGPVAAEGLKQGKRPLFRKKAAQKLFLCWAMGGCRATSADAPA